MLSRASFVCSDRFDVSHHLHLYHQRYCHLLIPPQQHHNMASTINEYNTPCLGGTVHENKLFLTFPHWGIQCVDVTHTLRLSDSINLSLFIPKSQNNTKSALSTFRPKAAASCPRGSGQRKKSSSRVPLYSVRRQTACSLQCITANPNSVVFWSGN